MINDMTVGMENLPNVFIDKIRIEPTSNPAFIIIEMLLCFYDKKPPHNSWRFKDGVDLKVHVGYETRAAEIDSLNNGVISLFNHSPLDDFYYRPSIRSLGGSVTALGLEGEYEKYSIKITKLTRKTNNLNIYAACFVDGFGFNNPIFDKFYGPMAAEEVYLGGQLNTLTNYFYYPDTNEEYGGPVHQKPNGSYMEGSVHTEEPHKEVVMVTEENYKIQAFNTIFDLSDQVFAQPPPEFQDIPTPSGDPDPFFNPSDSTAPYDPSSPSDQLPELTPTLDTGGGIYEPNFNTIPPLNTPGY
tara:strand:+ start:2274 stop:3170 length:897 start_codon:yes stop_codon:yes gene_type:complete